MPVDFPFLVCAAPMALVLLLLIGARGFRTVQQYQVGVLVRFGRIVGLRGPGLTWVIPGVDQLRKVTTQIVTLPIPSQKLITRDNVSIDVAAVAYFKVTDPVKSLVAIQDLVSAVGQIAQTTVRNTIGQFTLDHVLADMVTINQRLKESIDVQTEVWGAVVTLVELKDITLPDSMQRAMAKEAEAEREKRAKVIAAEGEFLAAERLGQAADIMQAHPIALQLRNLQTLLEISVEKNSTIIFPSNFFTSISDVQRFMGTEARATDVTLPVAK